MSRKVIHEVKLPKSLTLILYVIAIALTLNVVKPFIQALPAFADLNEGDRINVSLNWQDASNWLRGSAQTPIFVRIKD